MFFRMLVEQKVDETIREMIDSGAFQRIMADTYEKMAADPKYKDIAPKLLNMAAAARTKNARDSLSLMLTQPCSDAEAK